MGGDASQDRKPGFWSRLFKSGGGDDVAAEPAQPAPANPAAPAQEVPEPRRSWWQRLRSGLSRSSGSLTRGIADLVTKRRLDATSIEDLEDLLLQADLGIETTTRITDAIAKGRYAKGLDAAQVQAILATEVERTLQPVAAPLVIDAARKPFVILMVGVNGSGKTTTIGKLASRFRAEGRSVMMAAGDTFRAAAIEQLRVWAERTGSALVARDQGADSASLVYDAMEAARQAGTDILLIDTAGRLQNKAGLMEELTKVRRVIARHDASAPHAVLLVLDATVGQNAMSQVEAFDRSAGVTGLVMTKLDGTAKGGILVAIAARFAIPVHFIGVGETPEDLEPFEAADFARAIAGLGES